MDKARETAMLILYAVNFEFAYTNMALKEGLYKNRELSKKDKAFITNLVYGTVKMQFTIDYIIGCYSKIKPKKISPYILTILRMGIYQIEFMDKVPASAAVNESVNLAKRYGHKASSGFVNGILRNVLRNGFSYPKDKKEYISVKYSFPQWLVSRWIEDFGEDFAKELMSSMNNEPKMTVRVNTLKITADELIKKFPCAKKSELYENSVICEGFDVSESEFYKNGYFIPQDVSASYASIVLNPAEGENVLDICAAPGGKTTHIAQLMNNKGKITACDVHEHKIKLIKENAKRMGIDIIYASLSDASVEKEEFKGNFDKVLADVPCSGLGIIRRKPDIKLKPGQPEITELQYKILENAAKYLKYGGELVYSTCTVNRKENEEIIKKFLENNREYEAVDISGLLPEKLRKPETKRGYVTFYPNTDGIDGFFIAKIKRCAND